ncbi:hypothetical protein XNC1_3661 [Xenorhabdus nematophila ATCC 19061]|uniref:Uncharacterized protein n=1 Tax=Xenorhabdus nematophila (strain ATCC 19061 / DSM 3370 / CCUG 14189 / LMG 1036 / NCIMB 9965 / AN6) TaxID=406817 RepID=D3VAC8_XENNA|nr:hypothetical protein XNC1_3661 [Xenorhabdus nematophila ATCC 19061]CEK24509.1 hypothetical protein XNC2_3515 [Xenorhabdus nematophila AN6/1]
MLTQIEFPLVEDYITFNKIRQRMHFRHTNSDKTTVYYTKFIKMGIATQ